VGSMRWLGLLEFDDETQQDRSNRVGMRARLGVAQQLLKPPGDKQEGVRHWQRPFRTTPVGKTGIGLIANTLNTPPP